MVFKVHLKNVNLQCANKINVSLSGYGINVDIAHIQLC